MMSRPGLTSRPDVISPVARSIVELPLVIVPLPLSVMLPSVEMVAVLPSVLLPASETYVPLIGMFARAWHEPSSARPVSTTIGRLGTARSTKRTLPLASTL